MGVHTGAKAFSDSSAADKDLLTQVALHTRELGGRLRKARRWDGDLSVSGEEQACVFEEGRVFTLEGAPGGRHGVVPAEGGGNVNVQTQIFFA